MQSTIMTRYFLAFVSLAHQLIFLSLIYFPRNIQPEALSNACMTIVYSPQTAETTQIMNYFQTQNQARTSQALKIEDNIWDDLSRVPKDNMGIVPMPSDKFIYDYALAHPDTIQLGMQRFVRGGGGEVVACLFSTY